MMFKQTVALATLTFLAVAPPSLPALWRRGPADRNGGDGQAGEIQGLGSVLPEAAAANAPQVCEIRTIILSDKGQRLGALVVAAQVGGGGKEVIASALLPLGVDLTQPPSLAVGADKPIALQYLRCLQRGCEAMTQLTAEQQAALRAGSTAKVAVGVGPGKKATFDFSLAGFSAAHDALKKKTGAQ